MPVNHASVTFRLSAPAGVVRAHFVEPDLLTRWWPSGAETDPVEGGAYHLWWDGPGWHLRGRYLEVGDDRLRFTWAWDHDDLPDRTVDITFNDVDGSTRVDIDHEAGDDGERRSYVEGWEHFLGVLARRLAGE